MNHHLKIPTSVSVEKWERGCQKAIKEVGK
jgi:hypothetical protein